MRREVNGSLQAPSLLYVNVTWCGHCKRARPTLETVSEMLGSSVPVVSVDGDRHKQFTESLGVSSFPTILFVDSAGHLVKFEGDRTVNQLVGFVCEHSTQGKGTYSFCNLRA